MPPNEPQLSFEQPRSVFGTWLGVILLFAVFGLFVLVVIRAMPRGDKYEEKRAAARVEKLKLASEEAAASLHSYAWVDKEKGVARIPIQHAMELTVAELAQKKPAPAGPIATPAPPAPAAPATAPAATPAPATVSSPATTHSGPGSAIGAQPAAAANPPNAAPNTQPGPNATPAASPPAGAAQAPTPVQSSPATTLPVPGATP